MKAETRSKVEEFHSFPWFQNVGQERPNEVVSVNSWAEAMHHCKAFEWQSVQLQVNNRLAYCVNRVDYSRFQHWNPIVADINQELVRLLDTYVAPVSKSLSLGQRFEEAVSWDLMEICLETEFNDICEPIFFLKRVLRWYKTGHFPCGWDGPIIDERWEGVFPPGRLVVF